MRLLSLAAVSALALSAAACGPHLNPALRTRLDCPDRQGALVRASVSPDGKSCLYRADDVEVNLQLTPVTGDATTTLNAVEASLVGPKANPAADSGQAAAPEKPQTVAPVAPASASASSDAAKADQEARQDAGAAADQSRNQDQDSGKHTVVIDKNGQHVAVTGDGDHDRAHIDLPGIHIDADDANDNAKIDVAGVHIDASNDQATVRMMRDVRLPGEGLSRERNGVRATFIARRDDLPGGYRYVGYEAAGPKTGPLTIATVRAHDDMDDHGRLYHDIRRLVRRNGGA